MTENQEKEPQGNTPGKENTAHSFYELSRKIMLAAVGAAAIAQEEADRFVTRLAERGEIAEKDAHGLMKEMMERREKLMRERHAEWQARRASYASKAEVEALTQKIAELSKKLDELKKE
jgi:polyhydroxyalkanoate synthesis regulator phasin